MSPGPLPEGGQSETLGCLERAEIHSCRPIFSGSNDAFLLELAGSGGACQAVYKPRVGETPLWDFPAGTLCLREYASFLVSELLGWGLVPPTVLREGPYGLGSVQTYIAAVPGANYFTLRQQHTLEFQRVAAFDCLVNNADRKAGHCLQDEGGRIWCIDQGLTFHAQPKLRTVIWDFAGQPVPASIMGDLQALSQTLKGKSSEVAKLRSLLDAEETAALEARLAALLASGRYPLPGPGRHTPWPLI